MDNNIALFDLRSVSGNSGRSDHAEAKNAGKAYQIG
jgi:hypothetical protein